MALRPSYAVEGIVTVLEGSPSSLAIAMGGIALDAGNRTGFYSTLTGTERLGFVAGGTHVGYFDNDLVDAAFTALGPIVTAKNINIGDIDGLHTPVAGDIRWDGSDFEGYNGSAWKSLVTPSPAGLDTEVQFNNSGVLDGDANFTFTLGTGVAIGETTATSGVGTGALVVAGGVSVAEGMYVGGATGLYVTDLTDVTQFLVAAGVGELRFGTYPAAASTILDWDAAGFDIKITTQASNTTTGSLITAGGVGIAKNLYVGGLADITGNLTVDGLIDTTGLELIPQAANPGGTPAQTVWINTADGHLYRGAVDVEAASAPGGADTNVQYNNAGVLGGSSNFTYDGTSVSIALATASSSTITGALVVTGGVGIGGAIFIGGAATVQSATDASATSGVGPTAGALLVDGGISAKKKIYAGDDIATDSTIYCDSITIGAYPWQAVPTDTVAIGINDLTVTATAYAIKVSAADYVIIDSTTNDERVEFYQKIHLVGIATPTTLNNGNMWFDSGTGTFQFREGGVTKSLGSQTTIDPGNASGDLLYWNGSKWTYATSALLNWDEGTAYLTIDGLTKVDGVEFVQQAANPGTVAANTIWINSADGHLYRGAVDLEAAAGTPGGADTQIQYNNSGSFGGSANFTYDGTSVEIGLATASSSPATGALVVTGGVGIGDDLYVGDDCNVQGNFKLDGLFQGNVTRVATSTTISRSTTHVNQTATPIVSSVWATPQEGDVIKIKNTSSGTNTVSGNGNTIDGSATITLYAGDSVELVWDSTATDWIIY